MDQALKTSAIEDLNLASKILAEAVPMTTNDRIILALVEHALVKLESKDIKPLTETQLHLRQNPVKPWPVDVRGPMVRVPNLTEELKQGNKYRGVVHATEGQMHIFQITNMENKSEPAKYVLYSVEHKICSDWLHVSPEAALADMDYFLRVVVSKVKESSKEKEDDRGGSVRRYVANLTEKLEQGTNYVATFQAEIGSWQVFKVTDTNNVHPDGYCLYSVKQKRYSNHICSTVEGCFECGRDMDKKDYALYLSPLEMLPDQNKAVDNTEQPKKCRTFVDFGFHLKMNKDRWDMELIGLYTHNNKPFYIYSMLDMQKGECWYVASEIKDGVWRFSNKLYQTRGEVHASICKADAPK